MRPEQAAQRDVRRGQASLDLNEHGFPNRLGEHNCRINVYQIAPNVEMANLQAAPRVRPHFLGTIASADDPELFDTVGTRREVVEEDKRPACSRIESSVEKVFLALANSRSRGARIEDASRPRPASGGR
jgi:hypothetical protein